MMQEQGIYKTVRIKEVRKEVEDFKIFVFEEGHGITYKPGQYLTLVHFNKHEEIRRSYSMISAPVLNEPLSIGVKRVQNGFFSRMLHDNTDAGNEFITSGAGGFFILPADITIYYQLFFFAAGGGITPIFSLIKTALHSHLNIHVVLVYSNTSAAKTAFLEELKILEQVFASRLQIIWLFSNAADLSGARLHRDMILHLLSTVAFPDKNRILFYTCGPESYMRLCIYTLQEQGVPPGNIRKENFFFHAVSNPISPPDPHDRQVVITTGNIKSVITVYYPDSILRAAKKQGLHLPFSCEAGSCGNCVAKCRKGHVWHSNNEVLTQKEIDQGFVLTCVGHPVGGNVELEIG